MGIDRADDPPRRAGRANDRSSPTVDRTLHPRPRPLGHAFRSQRAGRENSHRPYHPPPPTRHRHKGTHMNRQPALRSSLLLVPIMIITALGCIDQRKEVALYRKVLDGPHKPQVPDFTHGQPLTLEAALILANQNQEQLAINGEDYVQAIIAKDRAYAAFLPTISLAPTYSWSNKPTVGGGV